MRTGASRGAPDRVNLLNTDALTTDGLCMTRSSWQQRLVLGLVMLGVTSFLVIAPPVSTRAAAETSTVSTGRVLETGVEVFSLWRDWPVNELVLDRVVESG
ncbi:hypothetical protein SAMN05660657_05163, partial [Geodermatophilus amargosae]